ncbi:hypothetical protein [Methylophaga sp. OBS3]|uniref:hypothetical protein n=1 Tax=Methylophaga sp. OBS3 TaxID=2991934 RepID=UPI00224EA7B2|nr:hypothetical protein [Methylophaga sp. OBS3]MCX4189468.1 hypothetical protein [Methylophaga sp. OBS3]
MTYTAEFNGWEQLSVEDLIVAYRKAKADCFFENTFPSAIKFAEYEENLLENLNNLLASLRENSGFSSDAAFLGDFRLSPKKLGFKPKNNASNGHIHFSSPERAFESLKKNNQLIPEFRVIGDFPVDTYIISALWINTIGHKFDAKLDDSCYGARLRRVRNDEEIAQNKQRPFHITAVGSFLPYYQPYQKWRADGLKAIRNELDEEHNVIAASLDLKTYYHFIDPAAIASKGLQKSLGLSLNEAEKSFTKQLADFLQLWSKEAGKFTKQANISKSEVPAGLVIGLTVSRVISNVVLHTWDRLIKEKLTPVHYGRYVDDMFLVLRDPGTIENAFDLMRFIQERIGKKYLYLTDLSSSKTDDVWQIDQGTDVQAESEITLQAGKQKLFILQGQGGKDLLDSIEKEIYELSSEHRLMPSPDHIDDSTAARVLSAAGEVSEQADTLRKADGLTIKRLGWALQLRHVESLARDLPSNEWKTQRSEFYQFAHDHILRPDRLFQHYNYLPRLLGFAVSLDEWAEAEKIVLKAFDALDELSEEVTKGELIFINGQETTSGAKLWMRLRQTLTWCFIDATLKHYNPTSLFSPTRKRRLAELFIDYVFDELGPFGESPLAGLTSEQFYEKAVLVARCDLSKEPYKRILNTDAVSKLLIKSRKLKDDRKIMNAFSDTQLLNTDDLKEFINKSRQKRLLKLKDGDTKGENYLPYLFPTRPYHPAEIAELVPECVGLYKNRTEADDPKNDPAVLWAKYVRAVRGVWIKPTLLAAQQDEKERATSNIKRKLSIGTEKKNKVVVVLTNIKTSDKDWSLMASGKRAASLERYRRISSVVNQAIGLNPKPDYVIFPELSVPLEWVDSIGNRLTKLGISLIAGTEYRHFPDNKLLSEAYLVLSDNRLGFPSSVRIWQPKWEPAVGEDKELFSKYGKVWQNPKLAGYPKPFKPVYMHNDFHFGVMICSEIQNAKSRLKFQGNVDALMVLAWNRDLDTFSSLVESSALDIHAYSVLVNNREYGDSRVRSPARESFRRDLARLKGGDNDYCVAVTLDIDQLRAFQSRAKRWPETGDIFKPLPEGYKIDPQRKKLPN